MIRILFLLVFFFLAGMILIILAIALSSRGKSLPFIDEKGNIQPVSISEKIRVEINGIEQGMFIRGRNIHNPVLLYLHGGMPEYFLTERYPTGLENYFTVVWWEQRGSGLSYYANMSLEMITQEQMISDTKELTRYLLRRFGREKIYLLGHSGGEFHWYPGGRSGPRIISCLFRYCSDVPSTPFRNTGL